MVAHQDKKEEVEHNIHESFNTVYIYIYIYIL